MSPNKGLMGRCSIPPDKGPFPDLLVVQNAVQDSGKVHAASVFVGTSRGPNGEVQYFTTNAIWKNKPASAADAALEVAAIVLSAYPAIMSKEILAVTVTYGFDIGIASGWH